jgi:uncharacterized cupin superfamily protein
MNPPNTPFHGHNYSAFHAGEWKNLIQYAFNHPLIGKVRGKLFLKEPLKLTGMEVSFGVLPPGRGTPFLHSHRQNEELYVFVHGKGQLLVDGEVLDAQEGTVVRIAPDGARAWRNNSTEDLHYIVIQAKAGSLDKGTITDGVELPGSPVWGDE